MGGWRTAKAAAKTPANLHDQLEPTPFRLKAALAHVQFETIHPFLDGNGRLLIALLLCERQVLSQPMLYLSLVFKTHRQTYYELLNRVLTEGDWDAWLDFFAEAVTVTTGQALDAACRLDDMAQKDRARIQALGRVALGLRIVIRPDLSVTIYAPGTPA